jgi:PA domain
LFGNPPFGGKIAENVYYANSTLCEFPVDRSRGFPSRPIDKSTGKMGYWPSPFILMVDRGGGCTFVDKVRHAQFAGAAAVLIADNICLCTDLDCREKSGDKYNNNCESFEVVMTDPSGSAGDITIPSFLVGKSDADAMKEEVMADRPVRVEMSWGLPRPDGRVEYEIWTKPFEMISQQLLRKWSTVAAALGNRAYLTPHIALNLETMKLCQQGGFFGDYGEEGGMCTVSCTNGGRYCKCDKGCGRNMALLTTSNL